MCGRYTLSSSSDEIALLFDLHDLPPVLPRYNLAPTQEAAVVRVPGAGGSAPARAAALGADSLLGEGGGHRQQADQRPSPRTLAEKASFKWSFKKKRCLIPADGFFEWKKEGKSKQPYLIHRSGRQTLRLRRTLVLLGGPGWRGTASLSRDLHHPHHVPQRP